MLLIFGQSLIIVVPSMEKVGLQRILNIKLLSSVCSAIRRAYPYLRVVLVPISARCVRASSLIFIPSV